MLSSTSNSNDRLPGGLNRYELMLAAVLLLSGLLVAEFTLRAFGLKPSVADSTLWWSMNRVHARGDRVLVIVGSSRSLLGIDPDIFGKAFPGYRILHLGIDGTAPFAVVEDLASDPEFRGIIVYDMVDQNLLPRDINLAQSWVDYFREVYPRLSTVEKRMNERIRVGLQARFVLASPVMGLPSLFSVGPYRPYDHMRPNRHRPASYRAVMTEEQLVRHRAWRVEYSRKIIVAAASPDNTAIFRDALIRKLLPAYRQLHERGGKLVLVRMPTTGEHWELDEQYFPRREFWDPIEPTTGIPCVHFRDYLELSVFDCPDTSHLDAEDVPIFSEALGRIVATVLKKQMAP